MFKQTKYHLISVLSCTLICMMSLSCMLEADQAKGVRGFWRLSEVTCKNHLTHVEEKIKLQGENIFWCFQNRLLLLEDDDPKTPSVLYRFKCEDGTLNLTDPRFNYREKCDPVINDVQVLKLYGIYDKEPRWKILKQTHEILLLNAGEYTIRLVRF